MDRTLFVNGRYGANPTKIDYPIASSTMNDVIRKITALRLFFPDLSIVATAHVKFKQNKSGKLLNDLCLPGRSKENVVRAFSNVWLFFTEEQDGTAHHIIQTQPDRYNDLLRSSKRFRAAIEMEEDITEIEGQIGGFPKILGKLKGKVIPLKKRR